MLADAKNAGLYGEFADRIPLREMLGDYEWLCGFSDYREVGRYSTSTLYLTTERHWNDLAHRLGDIRAEAGVLSRVLQYKNRAQWGARRTDAIRPWIAACRDTPGLLICVAWSNSVTDPNEFRVAHAENTRRFESAGLGVTGRDAWIALKKLTPFFVLAPLLQGETLAWYSDHDALLRGEIGQNLMEILLTYLDLCGARASIVYGEYAPDAGLTSGVELALSMPDLVSGVVADWLPPSPLTSGRAEYAALDEPARRIFAELAQLDPPTEVGGSPAKLHVSVVGSRATTWTHTTVGFSAARGSMQ